MTEYLNAEKAVDREGRQYHIGLSREEVADRIILVGDPDRAQRVAERFDSVRASCRNREFVSFTGTYRGGLDVTVLSTGIGCDNTEIAVIELCRLRFPLTMIRCGTCGALQNDIAIGDLVISTGAVRLENTSLFFVEPGYPALASHEVILALLKAAVDQQKPFHLGITATAAGFYGAQARKIPGFALRDESLLDRLARQGVKNFEMESSTLFSLATLRGFRAGTVCVVYASRPRNRFIAPDQKIAAEARAIDSSLKALETLHHMDIEKGDTPYWIPK